MEEKKKVLIISYYWPPSGGSGVQRWMYFCKYLPDFGFEPYVITVDEAKASYKFIDKSFSHKISNVKVYRTNTLEPLNFYSRMLGGDRKQNIPQGFAGESNPTLFQKISRFIRGNFFFPDARRGWNRFAFRKAADIISKEGINTIITTGPPHSTHLIGFKLKKKFPLKWIADFRDPWTEIYYNRMLYRTSLVRKIDKQMEAKVLNAADLILTIGPGMKMLFQKKLLPTQQDKVHFIYNGYDSEAFADLEKKKNPELFTISHIGILSENQPITAFLQGLKLFIERRPEFRDKIRLQFVGKISPGIIAEINSLFSNLKIETIEYAPHQEALTYMINADLLLNSFALTDESKLLVSGKLMEYIATGNPILGLGHPNGDAAELMKDIKHGKVFDRNDITNISAFIENIYLHWLNKKEFDPADIKQFSRNESTRKLATIINQLK